MTDKEQGKTKKEESAKALSAWHKWKEVCAVNGCSEEAQRILAKEIENGFRRKLNHFAGAFGNDTKHDFGEIDCVTEFDSALREYEHSDKELKDEKGKIIKHPLYHRGHFGDKKYVRKPKCWKDFTWVAIAESPDPELKVIRGKLTGGASVMNQIVEDYISRNCPGRFVNGCYIVDSSLNVKDEKGSSEEREFKNFHPDADLTLSSSASNAGEDKSLIANDDFSKYLEGEKVTLDLWKEFEGLLDKNLTAKECAVLLAEIHGIALYKENEILVELGIGKSTANTVLSKTKKKLLSLLQSTQHEQLRVTVFSSVESRKLIVDWMKNKLKVEKFAPSLLSMIDAIKKERES